MEHLTGSAFDDVLTGNASANELRGGDGNDRLFGNGGADRIFGDDGDDLIDGGAGDDRLDGGAGIDTVSYASATAGVTVSLDRGNLLQSTGGSGKDRVLNFENVIGSAFADTLTGNGLANRLDGGAGNDTLTGLGGADLFAFAAGGGTDTVTDFTDGVDLLGFTGFGAAFDTAEEILAQAVQDGSAVRITLPDPVGGGVTTVILAGFTLAALDAADFGPIVA
jgi:Ca2+-binding RTX toxin-like protein